MGDEYPLDLPDIVQMILKFDKILRKQSEQVNDEEDLTILMTSVQVYGLPFKEVDETMHHFYRSKWDNRKDRRDDYRRYQIEADGRKKNILAEYTSIKLRNILLYPNKADSIIKFEIEGGISVELNKDKLLNSKDFRAQYYVQSGEGMLQDLPNNVWARLLSAWKKMYGKQIMPRETQEDDLVVEKIMQELETFSVVKDIEDTLNFSTVFVDENDNVLVPSYSIETIVRKNKWQHKLTKIAFWLRDYLAKASQQKRVGNKKIRYWYFKKELLNINYSLIKEEEEE